jgi:hypothetical protein
MTIHKVVPNATRAGTSKTDAPARAADEGGVPYGRAEAPAAGRPAGAGQIGRLAEV